MILKGLTDCGAVISPRHALARGVAYSAAALVLLFFAWGCADPRLPTGGPPDRTPPALEASYPVNETVHFAETSIRLTFTEYVDQASFQRAFSITPTPPGRIRFRWRRRRVEIRLPAALRDSTTYVVALDNNLRDVRGVSLKSPLTLAFSTGGVIDQGRLRGRVVESRLGSGVGGYDVFAYAASDSVALTELPKQPAYRTQTGDDGQFALSYLRLGAYVVFALQDRNRNLQPDANEPFAVAPFANIPATEDTTAHPLPWVVGRMDTLRPSVERIRTLSSSRLQVRLSEAIVLQSRQPEFWTLVDSTTQATATVRDIYLYADNPRDIFLKTDSLSERAYGLVPDTALADSSGNPVLTDTVYFTPPSLADTTMLRFIGFAPNGGWAEIVLPPGAHPVARFNEPLPAEAFASLVTATDTSGHALDVQGVTHDGVTYEVLITPGFGPGQVVDLRVGGPLMASTDSVVTQRFRRLGARDLGSLSGVAYPPDPALMVELLEADRPSEVAAMVSPDASGAFVFTDLPEASFRFRLFLDRNDNRRWDGGRILPYAPAEPITWTQEPSTVRPRWDSALGDTLRVPIR